MQYGDAAELWRVNLGWSRRENKEDRGFWLDVEQRRWTKRAIDPDDEEENGGKAPARVQKVIPYVKDRRNSLVIALAAEWDQLTDQIGVDKQREVYKAWASKPSAYRE